MEAIGLVAAIPGLIEVTRKTISVIRAFADQKSFVKQITELLDQLEFIEKILREILNRLNSSNLHRSNFSRLTTVVRSLKDDLVALSDLFQPLIAGPHRKAKVLNRARLLISGLEGKIKGHRERLDKVKSSLTLVIVTQNETIVEENLAISRSNLRLKLNDVLLPSEYNFIPQNLPGTCEWIWPHPVFCEWQKDPTQPSSVGQERRIVCIYGPKGCGKSVLAASIVEKLKSQGNFAVGFSFWAGSHNQQKLLAFLRTFLWYMIQRIPDDNLSQISAPLLESLPLTEKTLEDAIAIVIKTIKSRIYCIIDGIDESVDDWQQPDTGGLRLVLGLTKAHANLRIVLLGRDASMRSATTVTPLSIEVTEDLIRPDINRLILHHLDSSLKIRDAPTRQLVQETLEESSRIMFLWVTLIFGELNRCHLPGEIARTLNQVPGDLDREYHRLFVRLQNRLGGTTKKPSLFMERAKCLLSWIIAASEPLTYEELRCAFAISQCPDEGYEQYMISEEGIMDTCGDFIRVSDGRYHMIHASIVEFLTRPIELWQYEDEAIEYFRIDVLQGQSLMFLDCINYFLRIDMGYPLVDASGAMSHLNLPIFSCALKFALDCFTRTYASEHSKKVQGYFEDFIKTSQFCSLVEYGLVIFQDESPTFLEQRGEIINFISRFLIVDSVDQLRIIMSLLETRFKEELAYREKAFGRDDDRFRTWKAFFDILVVPPEGGQIMAFGLQDAEDNNRAEDREIVPGNQANRSSQILKDETRRAAEHTAVSKIADMVAAKAPFLQALTRVVPRFTSIVPELLPVPFLILLALKETNRVRKDQYLSSALKRLTGANNFFEAYCALLLGSCRFSEDEDDETAEGLVNRCRQITAKLPSSLHVDILYCNMLRELVWLLLRRDRFSEAQEIVSELQRHLSNGPTKGYVSTRLERKVYSALFWNDFEAGLLANVARYYATQSTGACYTKALSIVNSNIQLYKDPGLGRVSASIIAYHSKAEALYCQWEDNGNEQPCELARESEAACRVALQLAKFPNSVKYISQQWWVLEVLCSLLYRQRRYCEARELISRIPAGFPLRTDDYALINVVATAACLGDIETGEAFLERASLKIQGQQVSLLRSESKHITKLIEALIKVRPILRIWLLVTLCWRHLESKGSLKHERDFWYKDANRDFYYSISELWDIFYIRYLALADDDGHHVISQFGFGCYHLVFKYAQRQNYEAAAVVSRYLVSYNLKRSPIFISPWSLLFTALSLHFTFRSEEALSFCGSVLLWVEKFAPHENQWYDYHITGATCFNIGYDLERNQNPLSAEFFKLAVVSFTRVRDFGTGVPSTLVEKNLEYLDRCLSALKRLGVATDSLDPMDPLQINPNVKYRDGVPRHQSCPDLRAGYFKGVQSHRTAYNLWRKQSVKPT
ncbi:hypothetical protein NUW58_g4115 [Xylaria curta]|uniref:Uncharacterized protein n=1 Tax=Xylaria curta TaxID=42375 RepID=A0ACC1P7X7_9PEZI|nr:hypothetical protein NUW58_g4115 [Xylaria curta]